MFTDVLRRDRESDRRRAGTSMWPTTTDTGWVWERRTYAVAKLAARPLGPSGALMDLKWTDPRPLTNWGQTPFSSFERTEDHSYSRPCSSVPETRI